MFNKEGNIIINKGLNKAVKVEIIFNSFLIKNELMKHINVNINDKT